MEFDKKLIKLVKEREVLYNKKELGYKDRLHKNEVWKEIGLALGAKGSACMTRWTSLRDRFRREYKRKRNPPEADSDLDLFKPDWHHYKQLSFLTEHFRAKVSDYSILPPSSFQEDSEMYEETTDYFEEKPQIEICDLPMYTPATTSRKFTTQTVEDINVEANVFKVEREEASSSSSQEGLQLFLDKKEPTGSETSDTPISFRTRMEALLGGLDAKNRKLAEDYIIKYLCNCQIEFINHRTISHVYYRNK